jgi:hypothetical protein
MIDQMKILKKRIIKFIPRNEADIVPKTDDKNDIPGGALVNNELLVERCGGIIELIISMVEGTRFNKIFESLNRRTSYYHFLELEHVCSHLETNAMFLCESGLETPDFTDKDSGKQKTAPGMVLLKMNDYKEMKWKFLRTPYLSKFFEVLSSKMEDMNQKNMVSFLIEMTIGLDPAFGNKNHYLCNPDFLSLINFFANMLYWSKRTRKFTYLY